MSELKHYGVLGMKWGIRRTPEQLGHDVLKKSKTSNLDKWGKDENHNILYITGYSGSGKSTAARALATKDVNTIHLDLYFEKINKQSKAFQDSDFNKFLEQSFPEYKNIPTEVKWQDKDSFRLVDRFMEETEKFGRTQFKNGKNVIIEGVQLYDNTTYFNQKSFFNDKPFIITQTSIISSIIRASRRDGITIKNQIAMGEKYIKTSKIIDQLAKDLDTQKGSVWVEEYLKNIKS